jgi:hypothetical protein
MPRNQVPSSTFPAYAWAAALLLLAGWLLGLGYIAIMPPFEGYDETAHLSRIIEAATPPPQRAAIPPRRIAQPVYDYFRQGPMPHNWIRNQCMHENDPLYQADQPAEAQFLTYERFFANPESVRLYQQRYREHIGFPTYQASPQINWQYQHPALYYWVMAQATTLLPPLAFVDYYLIWRCLSFVLAYSGLAIGLLATWRYVSRTNRPSADRLVAFGAFYPLLLPGFYADVARLTNDALCMFLSGVLWAVLLAHVQRPHRTLPMLALGLIIGLSVYTKILMVPIITGALLLVLYFNIMGEHHRQQSAWRCLSPLLLTGIGFGLVYVVMHTTPELFQATTPHAIAATSPLTVKSLSIATILVNTISAGNLIYSLIFITTSFVNFSHIWSMIIVARWFVLAGMIVPGVLAGFYLAGLRRYHWLELPWLMLWLIVPMSAGLIGFMLKLSLIDNDLLTPGYYFHIIAPIMATALAYGLQGWHNAAGRKAWPLLLLGGWAAMLHAAIIYQDLTVFLGYPPNGMFTMPYHALTWEMILTRLRVLAHPALGITCFATAALALGAGMVLLYRAPKALAAR